jgi:hypothetical protein
MSSEKPNGTGSPEDFKTAAELDRQRRAEVVELPSGVKARLVRFSALEATLYMGLLPQGIAARLAPEEGATVSPEQLIEISKQVVDSVRFIFVEPRVPDQLKPGIDIPVGDIDYALRWARGEVTADGRDLAAFRGPTGEPAPAPGPPSADVQLSPQRAAGGAAERLPD